MADKAPQAVADMEDVDETAGAVPVEAPKRRGRPPGSGNGARKQRTPRAAASPEHRVIAGDLNVRLCITTDTAAGRIVLDRQVALPKCDDVHDAARAAVQQMFREWNDNLK